MMNAFTEIILNYIEKQYGVTPDYLWERTHENAALRHIGTKKWFGVIIKELPRRRLGFNDDEHVDILDLKCDPLMIGSLIDGRSFLPGYHMNKEHWFTIILDGTVPAEKIFPLIDMSFELTKPKVKIHE